jgi:protein-L-isoaspartate O-methyltransferase
MTTPPDDGALWSSSDLPYMCLKDRQRTDAFAAAIAAAVQPGDVVVEVGAGTGILSFFAARAGATRVLAVEIDPTMAATLRESVRANGLEGVVEVLEGDARRLHLPPADVVIAEVIDTGLIEEMQVPVLNHLHEEGVIGAGTRVVPSRYRASLELVEVDDTFYGFTIKAPMHEWPFYAADAGRWYPTEARAVTAAGGLLDLDFSQPLPPVVERTVVLEATRPGTPNAVRLTGVAVLGPDVELGPTPAFNGDKLLHLDIGPLEAGDRVQLQVAYTPGNGFEQLCLVCSRLP